MLDVGVKLSAVALQIVVCKDVAELVITGVGLTVTVTSVKLPSQPFALGVILYTTVPAVTPSVDVSTWPMVDPAPALAPVTLLDDCTVQLKVVPDTFVGAALIDKFVLVPLQIVLSEAVTVGTGFTVTT
jgi:hypothetical protein